MRDLVGVDELLRAIDTANADDPNELDGKPLARFQGQLASRWLAEIAPKASLELQLAARAHHLRRWEIERTDFPAGRQGYLRWRRENKAHQADSLADLMADHELPAASIDRARTLLNRTKLRSDPETQALEDVACLVFLETQFEPMVARLDHDHLVGVVAKTLKKMSADAVTLAGSIELGAGAVAVLAAATETADD